MTIIYLKICTINQLTYNKICSSTRLTTQWMVHNVFIIFKQTPISNKHKNRRYKKIVQNNITWTTTSAQDD